MKLKGYFESITDKVWVSKDGSKSGHQTELNFNCGGDVVRLSSWHSLEWCQQNGIEENVVGEVNCRMGYNERGYYEQVLLSFYPLKKEEPKSEGDASPAPEKSPEMRAVAEQMVANAQAAAATEDKGLPF